MFFFSNGSKDNSSSQPLDQKTAFEYITAWARSQNESLVDIVEAIHQEKNGDFYGVIGALSFDYGETNHTLSVYGTILAGADVLEDEPSEKPNYTSGASIMNELKRIEKTEPDYIKGANVAGYTFELLRGRWQDDPRPGLYLKMLISQTTNQEQLVEKFNELSKISYTWRKVGLPMVIEKFEVTKNSSKL